MQWESYPHLCPSIPFPHTCWHKLKVEEVKPPTTRPALERGQDHSTLALASAASQSMLPLQQHLRGNGPGQDECGPGQTAGRSAKEATADEDSKYLLQPFRNTHERAAHASTWSKAAHPECGKKTSFQKEKCMSAWDTCKSAEHWAPQSLLYQGTGKSKECLSFNIQELAWVWHLMIQMQIQPWRCAQSPCSVCSILTHLPSVRYLGLTGFQDEVWVSCDAKLTVLHFCSYNLRKCPNLHVFMNRLSNTLPTISSFIPCYSCEVALSCSVLTHYSLIVCSPLTPSSVLQLIILS